MSDLTLTDRLHDVAEARHKLTVLKESEKQLERIATEALEYQMWQSAIERRRSQEGEVALAEQVVRERALEDVPGNGVLPPGITLKRFTLVRYDTDAATAWCRGVMPGLLILDTKRFERAAKEGLVQGAPVQLVEDVRATIASDLSAYLD